MTAVLASEPLCLRYLRDGRRVQWIADATGWAIGDLIELATAHDIRIVIDNDPIPARVLKPPAPQRRIEPEATATVSTINQPDHTPTEWLARLDLDHEDPKIRAAAKRAKDALDRLDELVDAYESKAKARSDVARLERELAAAKAALRGKPTATVATPQDSKAIRAWAAANDVPCPVRDVVPRAVVEAYQAAHG